MPESALLDPVEPVESTLIPANPVRRDYLTRITPERAKELALIRKQRRAERAQLGFNPIPVPIQKPNQDQSYVKTRLARVRRQIERLNELLESETDPAKIDRLASAIEKLSRIEQNLAGRPGPGQYRPVTKPSSQAKSIPEPL